MRKGTAVNSLRFWFLSLKGAPESNESFTAPPGQPGQLNLAGPWLDPRFWSRSSLGGGSPGGKPCTHIGSGGRKTGQTDGTLWHEQKTGVQCLGWGCVGPSPLGFAQRPANKALGPGRNRDAGPPSFLERPSGLGRWRACAIRASEEVGVGATGAGRGVRSGAWAFRGRASRWVGWLRGCRGLRCGRGVPGLGGSEWGSAWRLRPEGIWPGSLTRRGICLLFVAWGANLEQWFRCFITSPNYANKANWLQVIRWLGWLLRKVEVPAIR